MFGQRAISMWQRIPRENITLYSYEMTKFHSISHIHIMCINNLSNSIAWITLIEMRDSKAIADKSQPKTCCYITHTAITLAAATADFSLLNLCCSVFLHLALYNHCFVDGFATFFAVIHICLLFFFNIFILPLFSCCHRCCCCYSVHCHITPNPPCRRRRRRRKNIQNELN